MRHRVLIAPRVVAKLGDQAMYIADQSSVAIADRYIGSLFDYFHTLETFPERGHPRPDILPGLTIIGYRAANIAVVVERPSVYVVGTYFGGEDYEGELYRLDMEALKREVEAERAGNT